ncbi:hypothetical protein LCGC14_3128920, partial [marine sediment metagenome]
IRLTVVEELSEMLNAERDFLEGADGAVFAEMSKGVYLTCTDDDCPNYVDDKGQCVRIDHCPLVLAVAA